MSDIIPMLLDEAYGSSLGKRVRSQVSSLANAVVKGQKAKAEAAARNIVRRGMRRFQSRYRENLTKKVGEDPTLSTAKVTRLRTDGMQPQDTNTFYWIAPVQIDRRTTSTYLLNQRERDLIYLSGIKVCMNIEIALLDSSQFYVNIALVSVNNTTWVSGDEIFRNYTGTQRAKDFASNDLTAQERHCTPLNSDKYTVHKHIRAIMSPTYEDGQRLLKSFEFYVPIKRQIRYTGATDDETETKFRLIWWFGKVGSTISESLYANRAVGVVSEEHMITTVFREPEVMTTLRRPRRSRY
jgi:hypothetical protein